MSAMNPTYEPQEVEAGWYDRWVDAGVFRPEYRPNGEPFAVVIPPPNVTGSLHMGHALNHAIHDAIVRRKRMQGYAALWVPGSDHAGIATQNVVERDLAEEGLTRHDLGRERFVEQVWEWKRRYGDRINEQIRRMGNSVDWTRERFTRDDGLSRAVREVFVQLYDEELIYRGDRIINWCPRCETAIAEIEVEYEDEQGELTHIRYTFADGSGEVVVATTRPETMLGDTAVAVHPDDPRYQEAVGKTVLLPLMNREIPIVADDVVDPEFGTGAVKVTPAHDPNDFDIAERHGLPAIKVLDEQAKVTKEGGEYYGMDRFEAREAVRHDLKKRGFLVKVDPHQHSVGHCYRCGTVIEPFLSLQWFVRNTPLARPAIDAVRDDRNRFVPKHWEKSYFHWMENLRDWCISRQIWWGHRIPAWYCPDGHVTVAVEDPTGCASCSSGELRQDEDVLDTWFSSALWPFSTLGWPGATADLERFYPNAVLITGFDIIYFWVARMMQMGLHFMGDVPFRETIIHGLVRDAHGNKMSKSRGNTIDPLDVAEEHGADPLRLALLQAANPGQDVPLDIEWVIGARKFANKLWNAVRLGLTHLEPGSVPAAGGYPDDPPPAEAWVLARLGQTAARFDDLCDQYRFADAYGLLYAFAWSEVFDWYLEMAKTSVRHPETADVTRQTLGVVLRDLLKLFHPAIPHVTEELWSHLVGDGLLAGADWPAIPPHEEPEGMSALHGLVTEVRRFRAEQGLSPRQELTVRMTGAGLEPWAAAMLADLGVCGVETVESAPETGHTRLVAGDLEGFVPLAGLVDVDAERARLQKAIAAAETEAARSSAKLANDEFRTRAPAAVVEKERAKLAEAEDLADRLRGQLAAL